MKLNLFSEDDDKKVTENNITYLLNNEDKTASNIGSDVKGEIRIPCSINHKDEEYVITRICKNSFLYSQAEAILLPLDSEVRIIEKIHLNNQI
ncbi:hypothetical protein M9Y10_011731 [Tritrichomonas musculus]|uniref:Uncharacterized protein n=1 Tax=Tritrichomonas musculus TaxID=1915356 RepID=A0ABR2IK84_9EUKA